MQSQVRFNRVLQKVPEKVGGFGAKPSQVQQSSGEGSGEGSGEARSGSTGFPRRFRRGFQRRFRGSGRLWCRARSGSTVRAEKVPEKVWGAFVQSQVRFSRFTAFWRRFREALVQSQVKFNRVPEKVPEKVWEALVQRQVRFNKVPEKVPEKVRLWSRARSSSAGVWRRFRRRFREALVQSQVRFNRAPEKVPEKVWEALVQSQVRFNRVCGH